MKALATRSVAWTCCVLALAFLALDLALPLGVAGGIPYGVIVVVASLARRRDAIIGAALVGSVLTLAGYEFSPPGGDQTAVLLNRIMALVLVWVIAAILVARHRSETELRESEGRFRRIVDASADGIVMTDSDGKITLVNEQVVSQFGYTREELVGQQIEVLLPTRYRAAHPQLHQEYAAAPHHRLIGACSGLFGCRKDGTELPVEIGLSPLETREGPRLMATIRDISMRRRAEESHEQVTKQLGQAAKMEAIGQLAGGVAHDFNNLLTVIMSRVALLLQEVEAPEFRSGLNHVRQAARHAAALTHQLLAFSRNQVLEPEVLDLGDIVSGLEGMVRRLIPESIDLITSVAPELGRVRVDQNQVEQVILNLTINARDAMPEGGKLIIDVRDYELTEAFTQENVGATVGPHVLLTIQDTGTGMDAETQSRIFEPFFTTKDGSRGTGLGLATVYGIVKQSGGCLRVLSEEGDGATFEVYFPQTVEEEDDTVTAGIEHPLPHVLTLSTVLVVEDNAAVRQLTRDVLVREGHKVWEAMDCADAIKICREVDQSMDLLITDVVMPAMSGPELAERLLELDPDLKVLFVSGYLSDALHTHLPVSARTPFLAKPFTPDDLLAKVQEILTSEVA